MEAVAQIFFAVPDPTGKAQGAFCEQTKGEPFDNVVKKLFEQVSAEKEGDPLFLFSRLQQDIAALLGTAGSLSSEEQAELVSGIMQQIRDLLASGEEEQVMAFLQGLVQIAGEQTIDTEKLIDLAESFTTGMMMEKAGELNVEAGKLAEKTSELSAKEFFGAENRLGAEREQSTAFPFAERDTAPLNEKTVAELADNWSGLKNEEAYRQGPSLQAVQQIERLLSRRLAEVGGKTQGISQGLLEKAPFFKGLDIQTLDFLSSDVAEISDEAVETKLDLLQQIRELADKAEFRQSFKSWEAKIELKPEQLGATLLKMNMVRDKAFLDIFVTRPEAQEMVQSSLNELEQIFTDKGIVLEGVNVEVDPQMQFAQGTLSQENWNMGSRQETGWTGAGETFSLGSNEVYSPENLFLDTERVNCFA